MSGAVRNGNTEREKEQNPSRVGGRVEETDKLRETEGQMRG